MLVNMTAAEEPKDWAKQGIDHWAQHGVEELTEREAEELAELGKFGKGESARGEQRGSGDSG